MNLNRSTALTLRAGIVIGMILMIVGLVISMTGGSDSILYIGILVLIISPFLGIVTSLVCLIMERDAYWTMIAALLLVITAVGALTSI